MKARDLDRMWIPMSKELKDKIKKEADKKFQRPTQLALQILTEYFDKIK